MVVSLHNPSLAPNASWDRWRVESLGTRSIKAPGQGAVDDDDIVSLESGNVNIESIDSGDVIALTENVKIMYERGDENADRRTKYVQKIIDTCLRPWAFR